MKLKCFHNVSSWSGQAEYFQSMVRKVLRRLPDSSNIHGYLLTYPWIFHHVSVDISLRIHGYASFSILKTCFSGKYFVTLRSNQRNYPIRLTQITQRARAFACANHPMRTLGGIADKRERSDALFCEIRVIAFSPFGRRTSFRVKQKRLRSFSVKQKVKHKTKIR